MSLSSINGTPPHGIGEGSAVRMSAPNYWWSGVVLALRPGGRAEVMITDPGDSIHCPGQAVVGSTHALQPLRGRAVDREQARAQAMLAPPPAARQPGDREAAEEPVQLLIEAIQERGYAASRDFDDAVAYLGDRVTDAGEAIATAIELAASQQPGGAGSGGGGEQAPHEHRHEAAERIHPQRHPRGRPGGVRLHPGIRRPHRGGPGGQRRQGDLPALQQARLRVAAAAR